MFKNLAFEMYWNYFVAFSMLFVVFGVCQTEDKLYKFIEYFWITTVATTMFSAITGIGAGSFEDYATRYHASSMTQGETAYFLAMATAYFVAVKKSKYNYIYIIISVILIFATGCRKDLIYALLIVVVYKIYTMLNFNAHIHIKKKVNVLYLGLILMSVVSVFAIFSSEKITARLNIDRMIAPIESIISGDGNEFMEEDESFGGRERSIQVGLNILRDKFPLGVSFSFFDLQRNMQTRGYPTFPHSTLLFCTCIMGFLILIPLYLYIKTMIKLIHMKSDFMFVYFHFFIHNIISGGAMLDIKTVLQNVIVLWIGIVICKNHDREEKKLDENRVNWNKLC